MKKFFFILLSLIIFLVTSAIIYLSLKGYETDKLNNFIKNKIETNISGSKIDIKKIKLKIDSKKLSIFLSTSDPKLSFFGTKTPINDIKVYIKIIPLIKSKLLIDQINFNVQEMNFENIKSIVARIKPSNFKSFLLNNVDRGIINSRFELNFDENFNVSNFAVDGDVKKLSINILNKVNIIETNFSFQLNKQSLNLQNIFGTINDLPIRSGNININKSNGYEIEGNLPFNASVNNKKLKKILKGFYDNKIFENELLLKFKANNNFFLDFDQTLKLKKYEYEVSGELNNSYLSLKKFINNSYVNFDKKINKIFFNKTKFIYTNNSKNKNTLSIEGEYNFNDKSFQKFKVNKSIKNKNHIINLNIDWNEAIKLEIINYFKNNKISANINADFIFSKNFLNINKLHYVENKNKITIKNLQLNKKNKLKSFDNIQVNTFIDNLENNNFSINMKEKIKVKGRAYDANNLLKLINKKKNNNFLQDINKKIEIKITNIKTKLGEKVKNFTLLGEIQKGKFTKIISKGEFNNNKFIDITLKKNQKNNNKILEIYSDISNPLLSDFEFFKGIKGGNLLFTSNFDSKSSYSNILIENFKIKDAPGFVKLLALADLGGMADLVSGDGLSFDTMEIKFNKNNNILNLEELYAIGPSISILMDGYVENNTGLVSLSGTMVPAKDLNKLISKIPVIGKILIPKATGEGLFGVSFKMKGLPGKVKTSVNPIKTLTPRFITKALEKRKK